MLQKRTEHYLLPTSHHQRSSPAHTSLVTVEDIHTCPPYEGRPHVPAKRALDAGWEVPYDCRMINVQYSEQVALAGTEPRAIHRSCSTNCDFEWGQRCREEVQVTPLLLPTDYTSTIYCFTDQNRRFKNTVYYQPKMTPKHITETFYARPKVAVTSYTSFLDVNPPARKWFTSRVEVRPKTYSSNTVHNFKCLKDYTEEYLSSDEESEDEGIERGDFSQDSITLSPASSLGHSPGTGINLKTVVTSQSGDDIMVTSQTSDYVISNRDSQSPGVLVNGYVGTSWTGYLSDGSDVEEV